MMIKDKNKRIALFIIGAFVLAVLFMHISRAVSGKSSDNYMDEYDGSVIAQSQDKLAFEVWHSRGYPYREGGFRMTGYRCALLNSTLHVFYTVYDTTADNGTTNEYIKALSEDKISDLNSFIKNNDWKKVFGICSGVCDSFDDMSHWSDGMNDEASRNVDGTYKWEDYFEKLVYGE